MGNDVSQAAHPQLMHSFGASPGTQGSPLGQLN